MGYYFRARSLQHDQRKPPVQDEPAADHLPLYEAKLIHQFDHRWATYGGRQHRDVTLAEKSNPDFTVTRATGYKPAKSGCASPVARWLAEGSQDGNAQATVLGVTQLLFGRHLAEQRRAHPGMGTYPPGKPLSSATLRKPSRPRRWVSSATAQKACNP